MTTATTTTSLSRPVPSAFAGSRHYERILAQAAESAITDARPRLPPIRFVSGGIQQGGLGIGLGVTLGAGQATPSDDPPDDEPRGSSPFPTHYSEDEEAARFLGLDDD